MIKRTLALAAILSLGVLVWRAANPRAESNLNNRSATRKVEQVVAAPDIQTKNEEPAALPATPAEVPETVILEIVRTGTVSQVLAILPKIAQSSDEVVQQAATLQASLCRFQNDPLSELGFEVIKYKFDLLVGKTKALKPWSSLCSG